MKTVLENPNIDIESCLFDTIFIDKLSLYLFIISNHNTDTFNNIYVSVKDVIDIIKTYATGDIEFTFNDDFDIYLECISRQIQIYDITNTTPEIKAISLKDAYILWSEYIGIKSSVEILNKLFLGVITDSKHLEILEYKAALLDSENRNNELEKELNHWKTTLQYLQKTKKE